ncbi:hypothetical protein HYC85_021960 [Camellia sinensis]|uniref:Uncharacterized protein n=1 Tax=Camellia sinensis TaxID=4442 RepID=A0A7J7GJ15_CAMSI|nr:hypothetical protein HYC85_021960 [Camellia sinensis]
MHKFTYVHTYMYIYSIAVIILPLLITKVGEALVAMKIACFLQQGGYWNHS